MVLESNRLAVGSPADTKSRMWPKMVPRHPQDIPMEPKVSQSVSPRLPKAIPRHLQDAPMQPQVTQSAPQDCPRCPKETPKVPRRETRGGQCSPQRMPGHFKSSSKEAYIHKHSRSTAPAAAMSCWYQFGTIVVPIWYQAGAKLVANVLPTWYQAGTNSLVRSTLFRVREP